MSEICPKCGLPKDICICEEIAREEQKIKISLERRRYGKLVTVVRGLNEKEIDTNLLAKELKAKCACGGTIKDGTIELQGDHKNKIREVLESFGYTPEVY